MLDFNELGNWPEYVKIYVGLIALVPAPIVIPLFLGVMTGRTVAEKKSAAFIGAVGFLIAMLLFTFIGDAILAAFGISLAAFRLAGGFLLLLIALEMMRSDPTNQPKDEGKQGGSALALGIVPITIPILAGPGALSAVVIFATDHDGFSHRILTGLVILAVSLTVFIQFRLAVAVDRLITPNIALIFNKIMGLLIAAIAFEFVMDGIAGHFPQMETIH